MKKLLLLLNVIFGLYGSFSYADTYVNGYTKKDGTYVNGYTKSSPDSTKWNNQILKESTEV